MRREITVIVLGLVFGLGLAAGSPVRALPSNCVNVNMHPNSGSLPNATAGQPYATLLWVTPANPCIPILWTVSPPLPPALVLTPISPNQATIAGIPATPGTYTFT